MARRRIADDWLARVRLTDFADSYPSTLSGGMAQRAALARALVNRPRLFLLDEPFGKLDALTRLQLQDEILKLWESQRFTAVLVTHDVVDAAREVFAAKKNLRLLTTGGMPDPHAGGLTFRQVAGGFLVQGRDNGHVARADLRVVTQRAPTEAELAARFGVNRHTARHAIASLAAAMCTPASN